jgi:hypothetical protein
MCLLGSDTTRTTPGAMPACRRTVPTVSQR